jgi:hypothetical protein
MASLPPDMVKKLPSLVLVIVGIALVIYSIGLPLAVLDGSITAVGRTADIEIEFYESKAKYNASSDGLGISMEGEINFTDASSLTGGQFGSALGLIKGSSKKFSYSIEPENWNASALVLVNTSVEMIPFWPAIVKQNVVINVTLISAKNVSEIHIDKVYIRVWGEFNEGTRQYNAHTEVWEIEVDDVLTQVGQQKRYEHKIKVDPDMGSRLGIIGMTDIHMIDDQGNEDIIQQQDIPKESAPELSINIEPLSLGQTISIVMAVLAYQFSFLAVILSSIGITLLFAQQFIKRSLRKYAMGTLMTAGILGVLAPLSYYSGINTLVALIGFEEYLSWNSGNLGMAMIGSILLLAAAILVVVMHRTPMQKEVEFKAIGSGKKEEPEEDEAEEEIEKEAENDGDSDEVDEIKEDGSPEEAGKDEATPDEEGNDDEPTVEFTSQGFSKTDDASGADYSTETTTEEPEEPGSNE